MNVPKSLSDWLATAAKGENRGQVSRALQRAVSYDRRQQYVLPRKQNTHTFDRASEPYLRELNKYGRKLDEEQLREEWKAYEATFRAP